MAIPLTSPLIMDGSRNGEDVSFTLQIDDKLSIVDYSTKGNYAVENSVCSVNYSYMELKLGEVYTVIDNGIEFNYYEILEGVGEGQKVSSQPLIIYY